MGCYGIGVNRIIASLVETSHDENGIIWPLSLAPYEVLLIPINVKEAEVATVADDSIRNCRPPASTCCWTIATSGPASSSRMPI